MKAPECRHARAVERMGLWVKSEVLPLRVVPCVRILPRVRDGVDEGCVRAFGGSHHLWEGAEKREPIDRVGT